VGSGDGADGVTFKFAEDGMIPVAQIIAELHAANESYLVDVKLFSLVNRTLNAHGYRANVQSNDGMHLEFKIEDIA
jgi:hypothetical protein